MNRLLLVVLALLLAALGWKTWRLADASQTISTQADELEQKPCTGKEQQPAYQPVHSDRNQQPGAGATLCRRRTDQRTTETTTTPD